MPKISVVIPAFNESESLPALLDELSEAMHALETDYEIVVVDDGSTDGTAEVLDARRSTWPELRVIELDGNYGQSAAFEAGFRSARGEVIVTLDADGQNPPSEIPKLLAEIGPYDFVCGWRRDRRDPLSKRIASQLARWLRRIVIQDTIHDSGCSLKAMRRECVEHVTLYRGLHRFLPSLVAMRGFRVSEVVVGHRSRVSGRSHYGILNRLVGPLADLQALRWMRRRYQPYRASERTGPPERETNTTGNTTPGPSPGPHAYLATNQRFHVLES